MHGSKDGYWEKEPEVLSESETTEEDGLKDRDKSDEEDIVLPGSFKERIEKIAKEEGKWDRG